MRFSTGKQFWSFVVAGSMCVAAGCGGVGAGEPGGGGTDEWRVEGDAGRPSTDVGSDRDEGRDLDDAVGRDDGNGEEGETERIDAETDPPPDGETEGGGGTDRVETTVEGVRAYNWAKTAVGSHGTFVAWHDFGPERRLDYIEEWRRTSPESEYEPRALSRRYEVHEDGSVGWTLPLHVGRNDIPASERRVETFVTTRSSDTFVELADTDEVVEGIERVWVKDGLRAQDEARTRFAGVSAKYRDSYDQDEDWNSIERVERVVEFEQTPRVDMEDCEFDLVMNVAVRNSQEEGTRRVSQTFEDLSCSVPLEDGPMYDIVVDRFADRQAELRVAWERFLEERGVDEYGRSVFRAFVRGFVPAFYYDVTRDGVMLMGKTVEPLMVGANVDGPPDREDS